MTDRSQTTCPRCKRAKTRYRVEEKDTVRTYWICWPCYDSMLSDPAQSRAAS